jgi:branched-chain amino acid transport system substrate-binding protein
VIPGTPEAGMEKMRRASRWLPGVALAGLLIVLGAGGVAAEDQIMLGAAVSATGKYALIGADTKNGYDLAVDTINAKGGVTIGGKRYKLVVKYYDDESTPSRSTELAERLIKQDGVKFILGPCSSGLTKAMLPIVERYRVPMVEANGAAHDLFSKGYPYIFAVLSSPDRYLSDVIKLAAENADKLGKDPGAITVAMAMEDDPVAQDMRAGVLGDIQRHGMKLVIDDQLPPELNDMSMTLAKVKTLKPDLLLISGHEKGAMTAVRQIKALNIHVPILAITHCDSARIAEQLPEASENVFCPDQWDKSLSYRGKTLGAAADFAAGFKMRFGYEAPDDAAESAAAVVVFADALVRAQSLEPKSVRDAVATTDLETFFGHIKFDETGENIAKPMLLNQVRKGRYVVVAPKEWATDEPIILPPRP